MVRTLTVTQQSIYHCRVEHAHMRVLDARAAPGGAHSAMTVKTVELFTPLRRRIQEAIDRRFCRLRIKDLEQIGA